MIKLQVLYQKNDINGEIANLLGFLLLERDPDFSCSQVGNTFLEPSLDRCLDPPG